jgi:tRNA A37 threonylcarbamoyltransferase TsaD
VFGVENRSKDEVILGIESSFDESAACLVNSYGEIKSKDIRYTQPDLSENFNGGVDPYVANEHHQKYLPIAA